ncbi:Ctr copper transporter family-domain-containing protein [Mycena belliarum]|uniref:Copper transport protein n=1 Tax=Mycena belliarum TaxID=1033014 RepID=A0AAD6XPB1_9AGAR|nr:Ctr copper transporter family-domain-containing protein [Mycena belliae]
MSDSEDTCKLTMLWNWDTVDACIISQQWHVRNIRQYAGTLAGIFLVVIFVEAFRRTSRMYDRFILRRFQNRAKFAERVREDRPFRPSILQHLIRSVFYFVQFSAAYLLMLAAMTHNGGIILAIFIGALVGFFMFGRDTVAGANTTESTDYGMHLEQLTYGGKGQPKA